MKTLITVVLIAFVCGALFAWVANLQTDDIDAPIQPSFKEAEIGEIKLTDHDNQTLNLKSFLGKTVVLSFMFNGCSPVQTVGLRRVFMDHELNSKDKGIVFLSISVAPETDTPALLKSFATRYGIDADNWRLGITDRRSLDRLLQTFNAGKTIESDPNAHLNTVFLINPTGHKEKVYKGFPISPSRVYADLEDYMTGR